MPAQPRRVTYTQVLRQTLRLDRSAISLAIGARNAVGMAVPLLIGAEVGQPLAGVIAVVGALFVMFSDGTDPYRFRAPLMRLACFFAAFSAFVAFSVRSAGWAEVVFAALCGDAARRGSR